jgi:hypothetical protein
LVDAVFSFCLACIPSEWKDRAKFRLILQRRGVPVLLEDFRKIGLTILNRKPSQMQDGTVLSESKESAEQLLLQLDLYEEAMLLDGQFEKKSFDPNSIVNVTDRLEVLLDGLPPFFPHSNSLT